MAGRRDHRELRDALLEKLTVDTGYDKPKGIVAGFIAASEFAEAGEIIANLAYTLSGSGIVVCVVDFKVFYPNLCDWMGGVAANKKGTGLIQLLNSDRTEVRSAVQETDDRNIFVLSPSPNDDIEDYFNFSIDDIGRIIAALKETFDIVLIDIPNNPGLEFCVGALMNCQKGFFVAAERVDASRNIAKLMDFICKITSNAKSFNSLILTKHQGLLYDVGALTDTMMGDDTDGVKLRIIAAVPLSREAQQCALDGQVYIRDGSLVNRSLAKAGKRYAGEITKIANAVWEAGG